jgi:RND family efflux transporter MFP subunit
MKGEGEVDESDAGKIAVGQKVRFRLEAHPDIEFGGKIASILSTVSRQSFRSPIKIVKLVVELDATDPRKMRPGMRFRGVIETGRIAETVVVPADAVFPTEAGPVAFRKTLMGYDRTPLTLGARNEASVEVKSGLAPGDHISRRDLGARGPFRAMTRRPLIAAGLGAVVLTIGASPWLGRLARASRRADARREKIVVRAPYHRGGKPRSGRSDARHGARRCSRTAQGRVARSRRNTREDGRRRGPVRPLPDGAEPARRGIGQDERGEPDRRHACRHRRGDSKPRARRGAGAPRAEGADRYKIDDPEIFSRQEIIRSDIDRSLATKRIETSDTVRGIRQDVAKVDLALLDIERRKAGIAIERASKGLEALEIKAPHDGILVYKRNWRGDITKVGDTVWPGMPVGEIPDLTAMEARIYVLEADAGGLAAGVPATLIVEAHPEKEYAAKIKKVDTLAKRRTGWIPVQYFGTTLALAATDREVMKPGQRVRAVLALDARTDAISVPRNAVFEKDGKKIVYKRSGAELNPVEVTLGPAAVGRVVVENGLSEGDEIALRDPTATAGDDEAPTDPGSSPTVLRGAS